MNARFAALTADRYLEVAGELPKRTLRGFAMIDGDRTLLVVAMYAEDDRHVLISHWAEDFRSELDTFAARRAVAIGARQTLQMIAGVRGAIDAVASEKYRGSAELLQRIGFKQLAGTTYRFAGTSMREKVFIAERVMQARGAPVEIPVRHYFSDGVYAREIRIPAGTLLTGKIHKRENLNILSAGEISVLTEAGMQRIKAPFTVVSPPGTKRIAYAHTDCVWTTVHGTHETDLDKIEAEFIAQSEAEFVSYCRALALKEIYEEAIL